MTDTDLRTIAMHVGGRLVFTLAPPLGQEPVTWEFRRIARGQPDALVAQGKLAPGETRQAIDGIEAGIYRLLISGDSPLQRYAERLNVLDERTTEATIHIQSLVLELETRLGDQLLGDASVEVRHPAGWMSRITTDAEGRSSEEIWQKGKYGSFIDNVVTSYGAMTTQSNSRRDRQ